VNYYRVVEKIWGSEHIIVNNDLYCGKILNLKKGYRTSLQYHKLKDETLYVLSGKVLFEIEGHAETLNPGELRRIRPLTNHRITGLTDAEIIEFSTTFYPEDSYHIVEGGKVP
jgi:mannose-6-phosphate isomerase-like protein (cupin superfamily)